MVSIIKTDILKIDEDKRVFTGELVGLSTDTKPTTYGGNDIGNGSRFIEIDTGDFYMFDEESKTWKKIS